MFFRTCHAVLTLALIAGAIACTDTESATNLRTSGPPMIEQVRLDEAYTDASGMHATRRVFAFGTHPEATPDDVPGPVTQGLAVQKSIGFGLPGLRIIFGSLLIGNYLEEIQCNQVIDEDAYDRVPLGSTPDDIARCAVPMDPAVLAKSCKGAHAVCLCHLDAGCGGIAKGLPVGVLDADQDGAADAHRFIQGAVGIKCHDATRTIDVPIDLLNTYYQPSGFQEPPATGTGVNFDGMGPAVQLFPGGADGTGKHWALPTSMTCGLTFAPDVVGKNDEQVCAPPDGRPASCNDKNIDQCPESCTPGDVSAFSFKTEPLIMQLVTFPDGTTGVSRTDDIQLGSVDDVPLDPGQIGSLQIFEGAAMTPYTQFTVALDPFNAADSTVVIHPTSPTGFAANTLYTIVIPTAFQDQFHVGVPSTEMFTFTTGM